MSLLRKPDLKTEFGWRSDSSVSTAVRSGLLTNPVVISKRSVGWPDYEIKAIVDARIAGKTDTEIKALVIRLHTNRVKLAKA